VRTVVVQVEHGELAVLVGYRPASGDPTTSLLARVASQPKARQLEAMKDVMTAFALRPLAFTVDGKPLAPTSVRAKIGVEPGGGRPMVVVLVTYALPAGAELAVKTQEPRSTRISWTDRDSCRVDLSQAPAQGRYFDGVASFLLSLRGTPGDKACATSRSHSQDSPPPPR
jgi:hypothetical protein